MNAYRDIAASSMLFMTFFILFYKYGYMIIQIDDYTLKPWIVSGASEMKRWDELLSEMVITSMGQYCSECRFYQCLWLDAHFLEVMRQFYVYIHSLFMSFYYPKVAVMQGRIKYVDILLSDSVGGCGWIIAVKLFNKDSLGRMFLIKKKSCLCVKRNKFLVKSIKCR